MDMPADFTLNATLPPSSGKGAATLISVIPGYQSGQRLASAKSAMVSCGEALTWTLRCTIAIADLLALSCLPRLTRLGQSTAAGPDNTIDKHRSCRRIRFLREQQRDGPVRTTDIEPDLPSCH